jgi:hypothetical protein
VPLVDVKTDWSRTSLSIAGKTRRGRRTLTAMFSGTGETMEQRLALALQAPGVPRYGEPWPGDAWLRAVSIDPKPKSLALIEIEVEYERGGSALQQKADNPLYEPAEISWTTSASQEPVDQDLDKKPIVNSAGQPFDQPPSIEVSDPVLRIVRNQATWDQALALRYLSPRRAVNSDTFWGQPPGTARVNNLEASEVRAVSGTYYKCTYEFQFRGPPPDKPTDYDKAWQLRILDQGRASKKLLTAANEIRLTTLLTAEGLTLSDPIPLDGAGQPAAPVTDRPQAWLYFRIYPSRPFAALANL